MSSPTAGLLDAIDADLIEPQRLAECVIDEIKIDRQRQPDRRRGITLREALQALDFEAQLVAVAAENIVQGIELTEADHARLLLAWGRISTIVREVVR